MRHWLVASNPRHLQNYEVLPVPTPLYKELTKSIRTEF